MARKDGTPRVTPDLTDKRDATLILSTDKVVVRVVHEGGDRRTMVATRFLSVTLNHDETSELAQAMLDAQEETRR